MSAVGSVLVVGGGIAGLVSSRALALAGLEVTVLERRSEITDEGGIGIGMQSNAMEALGRIGLAQHCVDSGVPVETVYVHAPDGAVIAAQPTVRHAGTKWPGYTGMSRSKLHAILVQGAAEAGVTLLTDAEVIAIEQEGAGVTAVLSDGRRYSADLLVGADGIYSRLRAQLFPDHAHPVAMGEGVWRSLIKAEPRNEVRMMYGGGGVGTIGYTPLPQDIYLYVVDRLSRAPPRDDPDLAQRLIDLIGGVPGFPGELVRNVSREPGNVTYRPLEKVVLPDPWYVDRVVLIGDAAHAGPPTLAQGAAMGIEDGVVLAECLAAEGDVATALAAFMRRRYQRVRTIADAGITISEAQMQSDGRARIVEAQRAAAAALALPY
jgi:2-polyprenyl-6-methoxyphenol hydroxylase-like FAD-dependent oxidoreductase